MNRSIQAKWFNNVSGFMKLPQICLTGFNPVSHDSPSRTVISRSYFGSTGIGYTFARIPIAGTDFSTRPYTYDDTPNDLTLSQFKLVEEDDYKIEYLKYIKSIMPDPNSLKIFTTSWSAPTWMKNTNNIKWGENIFGEAGPLIYPALRKHIAPESFRMFYYIYYLFILLYYLLFILYDSNIEF